MLDFRAHLLLPRVLLIDDDMVSREVLATVLTMSGYTVHTAVDGPEALQLLEHGEADPEVILMDTQMPGLSGLPLMKELRAQSRATVFAISGSFAPDEVIAAADGFLLKPFGSDALRKALEEHGPPAKLASASDGAPEKPVMDTKTLLQLRDMMPEAAVREIFAAVVSDLGRRIAALETAIAKGDTAEVRRIGHAIKGGCAMAGAAQAAQLGGLLESGILDKGSDQLDNSIRMLHDLRTATRNLERMLKVEFPS
jgi:CheY-like chemotaxis protein/HPt (histidine-containing phosphotransfer) domain-containing protein